MSSIRSLWFLAGLACTPGCSTRAEPPQSGSRPPPEVLVVEARRETLSLERELPGRIAPRRVAEVRARVPGILLERTFTEGSNVKQGQILFKIDPAPLKARVASARAALSRARANLTQVTTLLERYRSLVGVHAVSQQEVDDAAALQQQRQAEIIEAQAALESATLDLGYATVRAPIAGRIGRALVTEGALVSATEATRLAVIQQLDPLYFDFEQSSAELLVLRRKLESGRLVAPDGEGTKLTLLLDDGSAYEHPGTLLFSDVTVDEGTGMVTLRAELPNPEGMLLPGMFARARIEQALDREAITVPQRSVALGENGKASVLLVGEGNRVERREIRLERAVSNKWVVASGLEAGARVILEGRQKARAGDVVKPVQAEQQDGAT